MWPILGTPAVCARSLIYLMLRTGDSDYSQVQGCPTKWQVRLTLRLQQYDLGAQHRGHRSLMAGPRRDTLRANCTRFEGEIQVPFPVLSFTFLLFWYNHHRWLFTTRKTNPVGKTTKVYHLTSPWASAVPSAKVAPS